MGARNVKGRLGEDIAVRHLQGLGYEILGRNVMPPERGYGACELDIVAWDPKREIVVFCEVKFHKWAAVYEPVTPRLCKRLVIAAEWYIGVRGWELRDRQIDVILVKPDGSVEHLENYVFNDGYV
ncbi:hypothetical protein FACS1894186_6160 [Alphaproteobacteria bacterium]|nr:hypothetical protein FACS1894186_6160 [Alphaproteobacteria bacterium]